MTIGQFDHFRLGSWRVEPASGKLERTGTEKFLRPKEMSLLVYLAQNQGRVVPVDEIFAHVWGGVTVSNDSLYFSISQLRKTLDTSNGSPSVIKTIPKRGYSLVGDVEFPILLETQEEVSADSLQTGNAKPPNRRSNRWRSLHKFAGPTLLVILLSTIVVSLQLTSPDVSVSIAPVPESNSIAVLPFVDLTEGGDHAYLSDGIAEEILNQLTRTQSLRVAARTSSFSFRNSEHNVVDIGEALDVATIVQGSVRKEGNRVRISVQLIDATNGFQLWSKSYDRELSNILIVQSDISRRIVDSLQTRLQIQLNYRANLPDQDVDPQALDEYLLGLESLRTYTFDSLRRAAEHFEAAMRFDPDLHIARVQLADTKLALLRTGATVDLSLADEAEALLLDALRKNPGDASAHRVLATAYMRQRRPQDSERELNAALALAPNDSQVLVQLAERDLARGDIRRALQLLQHASRLDPYGAHTLAILSIAQTRLGQVTAANNTFDKAIGLNPENPNLPWLKGKLQVQDQGEIAAGLSSFISSARIDKNDFEIAAYVSTTYLSLEMPEVARSWMERAIRGGPDTPTSNAARAIYLWVTGQEELAGEDSIKALHNRSNRFDAHGMLTRSLLIIATNYLIENNRTGDAVRMLEELSPLEDEEFLKRFDDAQLRAWVGTRIIPRRWLIALACAYKADGRTQELAEILQRLQFARISGVDKYREQLRNDDYLIEAEALALEGDIDGALDMLEKAVSSNLLFNWQIEIDQNFVFADLRSEPRYALLLQEIRRKIRRQRNLVVERG